MNLERPTRTPKLVEYATNFALKSPGKKWHDDVNDFDPNPIKIPPYQRKIVWDEKTISDFLKSKAVLFGTVILAKSPTEEPLILIDGLQRFATSTAILNYLHSEILPKIADAGIKEHFKRLTADTENRKAIFEHNDNELRNNTRRGIQESYKQLYKNVKSVINELNKKSSEELAEKLIQTFVKKQIAIDIYHGFKNSGEYTQTFININSTGMDLTQVDLLRSEIIQQAETKNWEPSDIDEIENRFTEVFQSSKIKATKVLGKHLYDALMDNPNIVFKNWDNLVKDDVDDLLDFIDRTYEASNEDGEDGNRKWPYLHENFQCGDIPFAIITWFYYKKHQEHGATPDFLGGQLNTTNDLHVLLKAFYRRIVNSGMNRVDVAASKLIRGKNPEMLQNMMTVAAEINPADEPLDKLIDKIWIKNNIRNSNTNKIRRIFNACLLPEPNLNNGFQPLHYGPGNGWTVDYLIPRGAISKNSEYYEQVDTIINKIPIRSDLKRKLKDKTCLEKLNLNEMLDEIKDEHPYLTWLMNEHCEKYKDSILENADGEYVLNSPKCLSNTANPPVGKERLEKIAELLQNRI